ncbi:MAG: class I SAM-dependent methyltransferase [Chloroflexota bacterium]
MQDPTQRFTSRVDDYIKYRPAYPEAVVAELRRECGLTAEWAVADIGSGPGNLSRLFLTNGNRVFGVEPNRAMREAGERLLRDDPRFVSVTGTAEATTLANESVDLVVAGQAFHWFERERARQEFRRILRHSRWVALVWNERRVAGTPFLVGYEALLREYGTDYAAVRHADGADAAALNAFFGPGGYVVATFENSQRFDFDGLRGRLLSSSYTPETGNPRRDAMLQDLQALFAAHQSGGVISFDYDTRVYYGKL